ADSLAAYRSGDLLAALGRYPENHLPASDAGRVYHAALLLAVGQVEQTEADLESLQASPRFAQALRSLIASVRHEEFVSTETPSTASEWIAQSYYLQSR